MFDEELNRFLIKFDQLRRAGLKAHLDLDTCGGEAWVGLRVMLGPVHQQEVRRRSPSYFRRQERRRAARATDRDDVIAEKVSDNAEEQKEDKTEEDLTKSSESEKNVAEEASFECELCDFVSNRKNGLAVHMSRKHPNLEQLDGNVTLSEPKLNNYRKYCADVLEAVHEEIENFLSNESNVGEANLDTWEDIILEIEMCKQLTVSEKKEEIARVIEARQKSLIAWYTDNTFFYILWNF